MTHDIQIKDSRLCLSLETIVGDMTYEQKREMLAWLASDEEVIQSVVSFIVGEDEFGWSTGDPNRREDILARIEDAQIKGPKYGWRVWQDARQKIKDIRSSEHLYWVLYHRLSEDLRWRVTDELRALGVESNYTTKQGDEDIAKLQAIIGDAFAAMRRPEGGAA